MTSKINENIARGYPLPLWTTKVLDKGKQEFLDLLACADCGASCLVDVGHTNVWPRDLDNPAAEPGIVVCGDCGYLREAAGQVNNFPWEAYRAATKTARK